MTADLSTLTRLLNNEVLRAMGLNPEGWAGRQLQPPLSRATRRFSEIIAQADCIIADEGMAAAARFVLLSLVREIRSRGLHNVPQKGPLVIASNHPGSVDSIAIGACAGRDDLKIIASAIPFLENLSHIREHLIFLPRQGIQARMLAVREGVRHLTAGGALLLFARGSIDPDPSFMPEADQELSGWSRSLAIFRQRVPQTRVVTSIVSHVIDPAYMKHPLTWLQRTRPDRQRLAMMIQVIQQMLGKKLDLVPHVSFGEAIDWSAGENAGDPLQVVVWAARRLLKSHLAWQS